MATANPKGTYIYAVEIPHPTDPTQPPIARIEKRCDFDHSTMEGILKSKADKQRLQEAMHCAQMFVDAINSYFDIEVLRVLHINAIDAKIEWAPR